MDNEGANARRNPTSTESLSVKIGRDMKRSQTKKRIVNHFIFQYF
jgi:hypothetical protein